MICLVWSKSEMLLTVQQSRVMLFNQYFPYEDFIALHDVWLFIKLPGDQQRVYVWDTERFLGVVSGQCRVDNKVCSVNGCVFACECVGSQVSQLLGKLQRRACLCKTCTCTHNSSIISQHKSHYHTFFLTVFAGEHKWSGPGRFFEFLDTTWIWNFHISSC